MDALQSGEVRRGSRLAAAWGAGAISSSSSEHLAGTAGSGWQKWSLRQAGQHTLASGMAQRGLPVRVTSGSAASAAPAPQVQPQPWYADVPVDFVFAWMNHSDPERLALYKQFNPNATQTYGTETNRWVGLF